MQNQVLAITFTLIFLSLEAIWLIAIRNRYIILVSLATILFGVQVLSFLIIRDHYVMGNGYFLERLAKLLLKDGLLMLTIWFLFYYLPNNKHKKVQLLGQTENEKQVRYSFSIFDDVSPRIKIGLILISFAIGVISLYKSSVFSLCLPYVAFVSFIAFLMFPTGLTYTTFFKSLPSILISGLGDFVIAGWLLYGSLLAAIIWTRKRFWLFFYLIFIFLLINNFVGCSRIHM